MCNAGRFTRQLADRNDKRVWDRRCRETHVLEHAGSSAAAAARSEVSIAVASVASATASANADNVNIERMRGLGPRAVSPKRLHVRNKACGSIEKRLKGHVDASG
jgi:hypothetical protein